RQATADLGVRPFGTPAFTLFGDYTLRHGTDTDDGRWGAGVEVRPVPGLHLGARLRQTDDADSYRFTLVAGVTLGGTAYHALPAYDRSGHATGTTFLLRTAAPQRSLTIPPALRRDHRPRWAAVSLENKVLTYQKYRWFDDKRVAWLDLARHLDRLRDASDIDGVAFNLAGLRSRPSLAWELRRKLGELRASGKEVVIHADNLGMLDTWLATAGDRLTLDPLGSVTLPGFAARRTYVRGTLTKLGVGFQELRFMPCKSAVEVFARDEMSDCERVQRGRLIDVAYETVRDGVCASRRLAPAAFDSLVDTQVLLSPATARDAGLVDALGRWPDLEAWVRNERHGRWATPSTPLPERLPDERWGRPAEVAVVFAVGECAMDSGLRGRATSAHLRRLVRDHDVKAVVLRADSPGGDPLPSDLIAGAVAELVAAGKPVVISQGDVAASGGYWISLGGSRLLTTPLTVTGSIGVISGWFWDDGLGDKIGMRADGVQRGAHADLFAGLRPPLLGLSIPTRPLDDAELALVKGYILGMYDQFVAKVAAARGLPDARVRELGGGRVWMGDDAIARGLCDAQGGLSDAIAVARGLAGIAPRDEVILREYPPRHLLELPKLGPSLPGLTAGAARLAGLAGGGNATAAERADADATALPGPADLYLQGIAAQPGRPLLLTPPDGLPEPWLGPW
ncbi:MAG: S49 family peptidase, partial [Candidatus Krumholzibacteriia bacterium]